MRAWVWQKTQVGITKHFRLLSALVGEPYNLVFVVLWSLGLLLEIIRVTVRAP